MVCALMACHVLESSECGSSDALFAQGRLWNARIARKLRPRLIDLGVIGILLTIHKKLSPLSSESSRSRKSSNGGLSFSPHWCMLYAFWSIAGLHPPKIGTF
jgi:hypothetical protein